MTKKNGFELHGIGHVSYSAIETYRSDPAKYILTYGCKVRGSTNANMARGNAVEHGIEIALSDEFGEIDDAVDAAVKKFNRETALVVGKEDRDKERELLDPWIRQGVEAMKHYGRPLSTQNKIVLEIEDCPVPIVGYDDFQFDNGNEKHSVDLKTTKQCPSQINDNHRRQGAIYATALPDYQIKFCYVTPKKHAIYEVTHIEAKELMEDFVKSVQSLEKLLSISSDPYEIASLFSPNYSNFYWNDPVIRSEAKRIFGV